MSHDPEWMEATNDTKHREEITPLLGEGELSLQDPEAPDPPPASDPLKSYGTTDDAEDKPTSSIAESVAFPKAKGSKEAKDDGTTTSTESQSVISKLAKPHVPPQNPCLWFFHLLAGVATLASLLLMVAQLMPLFLAPKSGQGVHVDILSAILKIYVSLICLGFVIVEAELPVPFIRTASLLQTFASRGFIYSFIGLVCTTEAYSERVSDLVTHRSDSFYIGWAAVFLQVISWVILGIGVTYMILGVCCLRGLRDRMKDKEKKDWKRYRVDLKAWRDIHG